MKIEIANIIIDVVHEHRYNINTPYFRHIIERFGVDTNTKKVDFTFKLVSFTQKPSTQQVMESRNSALYVESNKTFIIETESWISTIDWKNKTMSTMLFNKDYTSIEDRLCVASLKILISLLVIQRGGLPFHCSALRTEEGTGIVFSGQSTTGKTILARLMKGTKKWTIFNDEYNIILPSKGLYWIYATPFTSPDKLQDCSNGQAQIQKIFFLKHAQTIYQKKMTLSQKYFSVLQGTFTYPTSQSISHQMMENAEILARNVPIERLYFNPRFEISYPEIIQYFSRKRREQAI